MTVKKTITFTVDEDECAIYQDVICMLETMAAHAECAKDTQCVERAYGLINELQKFYSDYCDDEN